MPGRAVWLGRLGYGAATSLQERLRASIIEEGAPETLLLLEHDPVITLGKRATPEHLLVPAETYAHLGIDVRPTSRGGEATYHGPGQLVAYPIVRLRRGVLAHVEGMAAAVIDLLAGLGVTGHWRRDRPGVWVRDAEGDADADAKICAFGVHVRRGVAIHGLALNVSLPPSAFDLIVPCGQPSGLVTSIGEHTRGVVTPATLARPLSEALGRALGLEFLWTSPESLERVEIAKARSSSI